MSVRAAPKLYFVNPFVDFMLVGGAAIALFAVMKVGLLDGTRSPSVILLAAQLAWVVNWPHFSATSYRLYGSRDNVRQYPMTALVIPWLVAAGVGGSLASPDHVAPYFVKMFLIWSPYHFSGQTLGVTLLYARRAGLVVSKAERRALSTFIYGTFVTQTAASEAGFGIQSFYGVAYPALGLPTWVAYAAGIAMWGGGAIFVALLIARAWRERRLVPPIVLLPAVTQYVWFVGGMGLSGFVEFVPFFHSLQYLLIAWSMQLREGIDLRGRTPSFRYVLAESGRWGALNFGGGVALFFGLPWLVARGGLDAGLATAVVISGVQIHHFFVDGVIWKLKSKAVASPLMSSLGALLRPPAAPAVAPALATGGERP